MIVPSDEEYQQTKRIKQGLERLVPPTDRIADAIFTRYGVRPLNILLEWVDTARWHRLMVIFDRSEEAKLFKVDLFTNDPDKERFFLGTTMDVLGEKRVSVGGWPVFRERVFVIIKAFEPIARAECNKHVPAMEIERLKDRYREEGLWDISRFGSVTTFMFQTDAMVERIRQSGLGEELRGAYFQLEKPWDEFGYLEPANQNVAFDSRENFEKNYEGNWYYYYK